MNGNRNIEGGLERLFDVMQNIDKLQKGTTDAVASMSTAAPTPTRNDPSLVWRFSIRTRFLQKTEIKTSKLRQCWSLTTFNCRHKRLKTSSLDEKPLTEFENESLSNVRMKGRFLKETFVERFLVLSNRIIKTRSHQKIKHTIVSKRFPQRKAEMAQRMEGSCQLKAISDCGISIVKFIHFLTRIAA
ncbi:hypothetical protein MKW98_028370 [Papaver atlanticum]|uniref:Uncharacterized protein n=1 Tax=Papaver atlanticum TaxID=357466 RepID=A0AAD4SY63_9MAGN|nr:hypothetical protein MKW98_028370 [Papaver atlanticum]